VLVLVLALALAGAGCGAGHKARVPPLVGDELAAAAVKLANDGLHVRVHSRLDPAPRGRVVAQSPSPGRSLSGGATVTLTVSSGPRRDIVPQVAGQRSDAAVVNLQAAGFKAVLRNQVSAAVAAGMVISTTPRALAPAPRGSNILVRVSSGAQQPAVPSVVHLRQSAAQDRLTGAGFSVIVQSREGARSAGHVIAQSPAAKTRLKAGSPVTIEVARAVPKVTVPDVGAQTEVHAVKALSAAGLAVQLKLSTVTDRAKDGVVLSQSPKSGASVKRATTETVAVGRYVAPVAPKNKPKRRRTTKKKLPVPKRGAAQPSGQAVQPSGKSAQPAR
jgi:serine/threonine-protein kinase